MNTVDLSIVNFQELPCAHLYSRSAFQNDIALDVIEWFKNKAPWKYVETDFYQQYEFNLMNVALPGELSFLISDVTIQSVQKIMMNAFKVPHMDIAEISAHKLVDGHSIRIHNDYIEGAETHRLIIQFNSGWHEENGGLFIFFNSSNPDDICKVVKPLSNSAIGFAISEKSNHAVSKVYDLERYSLVYSFRERIE